MPVCDGTTDTALAGPDWRDGDRDSANRTIPHSHLPAAIDEPPGHLAGTPGFGTIELARLEAIFARMPPDDATWLAGRLALPYARRAVRLALRDGAIRALAEALDETRHTKAADKIAELLTRYAASGWTQDHDQAELPLDAPHERRLLHRILSLNQARCIGPTQLCNILIGTRTPTRQGFQ